MVKDDVSRWFTAFIQIVFVYFFITIVHSFFPARFVRGYVSDGPKFYRLNGFSVFIFVSTIFFFIVEPFDLIRLRFQHAVSACFLGLIFSAIFVFPFQKQNQNSFLNDFYLGRLKNPQLFSNRVDTKILLYLIGGILLEFNLILFYFEHRQDENSSFITNVQLYVFLFSFFLLEYFYHENVHLYTFDFLVEFVGFKLIWGCLVFYPFFYPIAIWSTSIRSRSLSLTRFLLSVVVFFLGWILSRGANNQKFLFRTKPNEKFLGFIEPESINGRLLCSGWWKYSRHINYLGDTLMSIGLTFALNDDGWIPWLYPLYYIALFLARERTDFDRCEQKYGKDWLEYCRRVPYRILPGIY